MRFLAVSIMGGGLLGILLDALYVFGIFALPGSGTAICRLPIC